MRTVRPKRTYTRTHTRHKSRRRGQQEPTINLFKVKTILCIILFLSIVAMGQFNLRIGEFTSEKIYDMLYYNEDATAFNEKYFNIDMQAIKTFWNQQR